jgi:hypothetical protein
MTTIENRKGNVKPNNVKSADAEYFFAGPDVSLVTKTIK